jgi:proliferating cell nuclear antigen PCNA
MTVTFKAKTGEAYHIKVLAELLTHNLKTGCFEINDDGISLRQMDNNRKTLIDLELHAENFSLYKFKDKDKDKEKKNVGLNLNHYHRMLKSIKKKDSLQLLIDTDEPNDLAIKAIPKENTRVTTSYIKIQNMQNVEIDLPTGYGKPVIVTSSEFQKMTKDLLNIGKEVRVESHGPFGIQFHSDADNILKRKVEFGEIEDSDWEEEEEKTQILYNQKFATDQLARISKIAGLSQTMQIFCAAGLPLLFRSQIGSLGRISIYIKSKEQVALEAQNEDSGDESE